MKQERARQLLEKSPAHNMIAHNAKALSQTGFAKNCLRCKRLKRIKETKTQKEI